MKTSFKNILLPVNFSESCDNAIETGISMCKRHGSVLHLLYVKEDANMIFPPGKNPKLLEMILEAEVASLDRLEALANRIIDQHQILCFYYVVHGPYYRAITSKAKDLYCDLIILEKSQVTNRFSFLKTNSIYKVLKHSGCALLTVPHDKVFLNFRNVLFPIRPIRAGLEKLNITLPIIRKNESKVLLFSSLKPGIKPEDRQRVDNFMRKADELISRDSLTVERELTDTADMAKEVVKKAIEKKSDLIVISATIKKGLKALFFRNYTQRVIECSPIPVLSVKIR